MKQKLLRFSLLSVFALLFASGAWAQDTYTKVTSASDLVAGGTYIIAGANGTTTYVATGYSSNSLSIVTSGFSVSGNNITTSTATPLEFTLGGTSAGYTLQFINDNKTVYLGYNGSSTNLRTQESSTDNKEKWTFNTTTYAFMNVATNTRYIGIATSGTISFKAYSTGGTNPKAFLYKKQPSTTPKVTLNVSSLAFGRVKAGATKELTFTVTPENLTGALTIASNNDKYTVSPTSIAQNVTAETTITVTAAPTAVEDDMSGTITVSGGGITSKSVSLSCVVRDPSANDGTAAKPYTVAEARTLIDETGTARTGLYVVGKISQIDEVNTEDGYATYWISDDGTTTNQLEAYRGKYLENADFASEDQIGIGDQVVIVGDLTKYSGTYEFTSGNYIYSRVADTRLVAGLAWSADAVEINKGATESEYTLPTLTNPHSLPITYTVTGTDDLAIEVDGEILVDTDIEGEVTITASFAGNASYKPANVSYTITVVDKTKKGSIYNPYTVAEVLDGTATGNGIYVQGYIVGEFVGKSTNPRTSGFTTDANIALADAFTSSPTVASSIPVALPIDALKTAWGNKTNSGSTMGYQVLVKGNAEGYFNVNGIKSTTEVIAVKVPAKIGATGYTTFASTKALDLSDLPAGLTAYKASAVSGNKVTFTAVTDAVPAGTGLLLEGTASQTYAIPVAATASALADNLLVGCTASTNLTANASYYVMVNDGGTAKFQSLEDNGATIPAGKAYLAAPAGARQLTFDFGDATGIDNELRVNSEDFATGAWYTLDGRRVANPTKGIYIVNGKKVVIK